MTDGRRCVLITGSAGFLGEAALERITATDPSSLVICVDTRPTRGPDGDTKKFVSVTRDIREPLDDLLQDYEVDTVIHLAFVLQPQNHPVEAHQVNVDATARLTGACAKAGVRQFIYLSSATVYGAHPGNDHSFKEDEPANPVSGFVYSEQKVEAERIVNSFAENYPDCAVSVLRGCVVMGPGADNFITDSLGLRVLPVALGANPEMQFLHVSDYSNAIDIFLREKPRGIFNIAGAGTVTWREMISIAGSKGVPTPVPLLKLLVELTWALKLQRRSNSSGLAFIRDEWLVSTEHLKAETGWSPEISSREALLAWAAARKKIAHG